jgi:thermitase
MAIATNFADTEVVEGLNYAADNGARVVSMSFGVYSSWMVWDFTIIETALQYCQDKNLVLVAASGNENQAVARFLDRIPEQFCVGGSNPHDIRKSIGDTSIENWWGACYGPDLDVVAPCLEIYTTDRLGALGYTPTDYDPRFNGTSSATPHVAALAGLIVSLNPTLSNTDVRKIISETCDKISVGT